MNLVRWQPRTPATWTPVRDVEAFGNEVDRMLDWAFGGTGDARSNRSMVPAMDVIENQDHYLVRADLPGLTKDDIEITYQDGVLTLKGEKKVESENAETRIYRRERFVGKFGRTLSLPQKLDADKIQATFDHGVLELKLPFSPEAQPRKIQIKAS